MGHSMSGICSCCMMPSGTTGGQVGGGHQNRPLTRVPPCVRETDPALGANVLSVLHRIGQQSGPDLKRLGLGQARTMLDLGGGAGTNAIAFCRVYPTLSATVFDLATTLPLTERTVKRGGA